MPSAANKDVQRELSLTALQQVIAEGLLARAIFKFHSDKWEDLEQRQVGEPAERPWLAWIQTLTAIKDPAWAPYLESSVVENTEAFMQWVENRCPDFEKKFGTLVEFAKEHTVPPLVAFAKEHVDRIERDKQRPRWRTWANRIGGLLLEAWKGFAGAVLLVLFLALIRHLGPVMSSGQDVLDHLVHSGDQGTTTGHELSSTTQVPPPARTTP